MIDYRQHERPHFDVQMQLQKIQANQLYSYADDLNRFGQLGSFLSGEIDATVQMSGDLNDSLGLDLETFSSVGTLQTRHASFAGHPVQEALVGFLSAPQLGRLAVSDWLQPFHIQDGRVGPFAVQAVLLQDRVDFLVDSEIIHALNWTFTSQVVVGPQVIVVVFFSTDTEEIVITIPGSFVDWAANFLQSVKR